jgi:hypothetical protein
MQRIIYHQSALPIQRLASTSKSVRKAHKCNCDSDVPRSFISKCTTKGTVSPAQQTRIVKEWLGYDVVGLNVCYAHRKAIASIIGFQVKSLDMKMITQRLRVYHEAIMSNSMGNLKTAKTTYTWFRIANRPAHPSDRRKGLLSSIVSSSGQNSDDPARRLSLQLTGCNFQIWLTVGGDKTTMMVNTLVDIIEGATYDEIEKWPRRMLPADKSKGRTTIQYTS